MERACSDMAARSGGASTAAAAQSMAQSPDDGGGGTGSWLGALGLDGGAWFDFSGAPNEPGKDEPSCACSSACTASDPPNVDEGFAGTGFYPSEIAAAAAYGLFVGSAWSGVLSGPLPLGPGEDITDEELMAARPRDVIKAAHRVRLQAIQSRRAKTSANDAAAQNHEAGAGLGGAEGAGMDAEMCAVCQINFEEREHCLACRSCDSGFHVACLNKWLLRADTCPCCRTKVSALTPLSLESSGVQEEEAL